MKLVVPFFFPGSFRDTPPKESHEKNLGSQLWIRCSGNETLEAKRAVERMKHTFVRRQKPVLHVVKRSWIEDTLITFPRWEKAKRLRLASVSFSTADSAPLSRAFSRPFDFSLCTGQSAFPGKRALNSRFPRGDYSSTRRNSVEGTRDNRASFLRTLLYPAPRRAAPRRCPIALSCSTIR